MDDVASDREPPDWSMSRTRTAVLATVIAGALVAVSSGCTQQVADVADVPMHEIRVSGSGTTMPLVRLLANAYPSDDVEFVYLPGVHSGGGITGVANGDLDLGAISRDLEADEADLDVAVHDLADDALGIAVHPTVSVTGLTSSQVRSIYSGVVDDWSDVGGSPGPITVLDRPEDESAKRVLREVVLGPDFEVFEAAVQLYYEDDMLDGVESTPGSIGYVSYGMAKSRDADVRFVEIDGVMPSVGTVRARQYPMTRGLGVVVAKDAPYYVLDLVEWMRTDEAADAMMSQGYAPAGVSGE
jgi:phosphate transport system substrate-binding protein